MGDNQSKIINWIINTFINENLSLLFMKIRKFIFILFLIIFLSNITITSALPDQTTIKSGNLCERGHYFEYNYNFIYDNKLEIGKTYDLDISFFISGSRITDNPYKVNVKINPQGFDISENVLSLNSDKTIKIIPKTENPVLNIETNLVLDGDARQHRNYEATYKDNFKLDNFLISNSNIIDFNNETESTNNKTTKNLSTIKTESKEITKSTETNSTKTITNLNVSRSQPSEIPWYIVRLTGVLAYILLSLSILVALLRKINPVKFRSLFKYHHDISIFAIIFTFLHLINNLFDKYMWSLEFKDLFWFSFSSNTKILLSIGVLSFYLMTIIVISSLSPKIIKFIKYKNWYHIHLLSYLTYIFVIIHSLFLGTDLDISNIKNPLTLITFSILSAFTLLNLIFSIVLVIKKINGEKK